MPGSHSFPPQNFRHDHFLISTEREKINVQMVHHFLAHESYWAKGVAMQFVQRSLDYSLCFGVYDCSTNNEAQIGFARVISDYTSFAYLADVFILSAYQAQGLGKWLISCILAHPELQGMHKWMLNTKDAQGFNERFGFHLNPEPETYMVNRLRSG